MYNGIYTRNYESVTAENSLNLQLHLGRISDALGFVSGPDLVEFMNNRWGSYCSDVEVIGDICEYAEKPGSWAPKDGAIDRWIGDIYQTSDGRVGAISDRELTTPFAMTGPRSTTP